MSKFNINKVLAIALSVATLTFVACADDEESVNNNRGYSKTAAGDYSQYENTTLSVRQIMETTAIFSDAINGKIAMPTMDITNGLLAMETFFNYGIVDKQKDYDPNGEYDEQKFTFTVPCEDNTMSGSALKEAYIAFIDNVLAQMGNKYLQFSDLRVSDKTNNSVTFELRIPRLDMGLIDLPRITIVKNYGEPISVPNSVSLNYTIPYAQYVDKFFSDYYFSQAAVYSKKSVEGLVVNFRTEENDNLYNFISRDWDGRTLEYRLWANEIYLTAADLQDVIIPAYLYRFGANNPTYGEKVLVDFAPVGYMNFYIGLKSDENDFFLRFSYRTQTYATISNDYSNYHGIMATIRYDVLM